MNPDHRDSVTPALAPVIVTGQQQAVPAPAALSAAEGHRSLTLPVDLSAPRLARQHVVQILRGEAVADDAVRVVELLVSEVVTNVVRHENSLEVDVDVTVHHDLAVTVTVSGGPGGPGGGPSAPAVPLAYPGAPDHPAPVNGPNSARGTQSEGGRGLSILDAMATEWGTRRAEGRTAVWFAVRNPELAAGSVINAAQAVVAEAIAITDRTEAELTAKPAVVAGRAAVAAEHAAVDAAFTTARAAHRARAARSRAATLAAEAVAEAAARTVAAVQAQADDLAADVARAADLAARTVAETATPGGDAEAARAALLVASTVLSAAAAKQEETARAAVVVAQAVAAAATAVSATTAAAAAAMEHEVADTAAAVQAVTDATAEQLANDTVERAAALTLATTDAAAASERWQQANDALLRSGRHDHAVAVALQGAMLTQLPQSEDLQLAARYVTAAEHHQVGGDWYDAIIVPGRSTTLVIGDVAGHDIGAAAVMGQLRNLLRALVWDRNEPPSVLVGRLDRATRDLRIDTVATMIVLKVDHDASGDPTLSWTNAGHPAPILIHDDGTVLTLDDTTDLLLGVRPDTMRRDHIYPVEPGATLLLYTDGLIETRSSGIEAGQARLLTALRTYHHLAPGDLLDAVLASMVGTHPADDVAVLAVRFNDPVVRPSG